MPNRKQHKWYFRRRNLPEIKGSQDEFSVFVEKTSGEAGEWIWYSYFREDERGGGLQVKD